VKEGEWLGRRENRKTGVPDFFTRASWAQHAEPLPKESAGRRKAASGAAGDL